MGTRVVAEQKFTKVLRHLPGSLRAGLMDQPLGTLLRIGREIGQGPHYLKDLDVVVTMSPFEPTTDMGWPIKPDGFRQLLLHVHKRYKPKGVSTLLKTALRGQ